MAATEQRNYYDDPGHWRTRAKQVRGLALVVIDQDYKARLERRALEYESLADWLEKEAPSPACHVSATDFIRNFPTYREMAKQEPVPVSDYGKVTGYFISVSDYEELERGRGPRKARSV
jgi:hypothetical protein